VLVPDSDQSKALRALSRAREDLVGTRVALANELGAQLQCFWPGAAGVFAEIAALEPIVAKIAQLTSEIRGVLAEHDDGATFRSLFKDPTSAITAATMLAEIGDCRERYPTKQALSADGGQSPVAVESGKSKRARFRWACDHRFRNAIGTLADTSRHHNPWAADIYQRAIARGATHPHAIRILGRVGIPANAFVAKGKARRDRRGACKAEPGCPERPCHGGPTTHSRRLPTPGSRPRYPRIWGSSERRPARLATSGKQGFRARQWVPGTKREHLGVRLVVSPGS
jgi:hypothetical protein